MAERPSRAYKLKLSKKGIALFLHCHCRLCHLVSDLLPYGTTLRLSVTMLEAMPIEELAAELACDDQLAFAGQEVRFVGTAPSLAAVTASLAARVAATAEVDAPPQTWRLFIAALSLMRDAEDSAILRAYARLAAT